MDNNLAYGVEYSEKNRKKAYFAVCRVSLVLLFFAFSSRILSELAVTFIYGKSAAIQNFFVTVLSLFGVEAQLSYAAAKMLLSSEAFYEMLSLVISFVSIVIPAIVFSRLTHLRYKECFNIKGKMVKWFIPMFFLCQLFTMLSSSISQSIYSFLVPDWAMSTDAWSGVVASEFNIYEFLIRVFCSCIIVPVVEEYVFRGIIFTYLKEYGLAFGVIASSLMFGIAHSAPVQSVYAFSFGLFSAFLVVVTGNLKSSILFHALNNFITVGTGYIMGLIDDRVFIIFNAVYIMVVSTLGFACLYKMFSKGGFLDEFASKSEENDGGLMTKPGLREVLAFPVALYVVFYILEIVSRVF